MKTARWTLSILICAAVAFAAIEIRASGPVAVYAIVDKVVFEPNEANPERIQIWGAFSIETQIYGTNYSPAQRGYLYYKTDKSYTGVEQRTRSAWADLKKVAGTGEAVGSGGGYAALGAGRVRKVTDKPKGPDAFPLGNPVVKLGASQTEVVANLKAVLQAR